MIFDLLGKKVTNKVTEGVVVGIIYNEDTFTRHLKIRTNIRFKQILVSVIKRDYGWIVPGYEHINQDEYYEAREHEAKYVGGSFYYFKKITYPRKNTICECITQAGDTCLRYSMGDGRMSSQKDGKGHISNHSGWTLVTPIN